VRSGEPAVTLAGETEAIAIPDGEREELGLRRSRLTSRL
jgi:hypothetical protein